MTVHLNSSVSVMIHKLTELNKTCMDAILKELPTVMNENRRNKVSTMIKQLQMLEYSIDISHSFNLHFNISSKSNGF